MTQFTYRDGTPIRLGDVVSFGTPFQGKVTHIVDDSKWGLNEDTPVGLYVETSEIGTVRLSPEDETLMLIRRAKSE